MNQFDEEVGKSASSKPPNKKASVAPSEPKPIKSSRALLLSGAALAVVGLLSGVGYVFYSSRAGVDTGVGNTAMIAPVPTVKNDSFAPVGVKEADRRATLNEEVAEEASERGDSHVAQTVIVDKYEVGDERDPFQDELKKAEEGKAQAAAQQEPPQEKIVYVDKVIYRDRPSTDPVFDDSTLKRIESQIDYAQKAPQTRFVSMAFKKPAPAQPTATAANSGAVANVGTNFNQTGQLFKELVAQPGDIFYGILWLGFNSDDPRGAPVYATIYDNKADGTTGPLSGARLEGQVAYSNRNAALQFNRIILKDGRTISASALAVDENNARLGIAQKVDFHTFERYSSLLMSTLIEGVGQAANTMLTNNRTVTYLPDSDTIVSANDNKNEWTKAGLAALQPLGTALSGAARQGFNRPPTISANRGHRVGIVFTSQVEM